MLKRSLQAYVKLDAEAARLISKEDDEIDNLYEQVYRELAPCGSYGSLITWNASPTA